MNLATLLKAFDAAVALRETAKRFRATTPASPDTSVAQVSNTVGAQVEARLTNVVVAALKEAFDRDHARLELERAQMEEQRRRADEAMRLELRRQAADREISRLRLLAGTALVGWIASVLLFVPRIASVSVASRAILAASWLLLLAALAAAFTAQGRVGAQVPDGSSAVEPGRTGAPAVWLLVGGLGLTAVSLLF